MLDLCNVLKNASNVKSPCMKKLTLSVSEPCCENWGKMTPDEKGRFCATCQKKVIDFTNMSDRQLAEFFEKPTGSVCGRFHHDQLGRPIQIPRKQSPWIKYFFQFTWPAFVLFLKSCGQKIDVAGDIEVQEIKMTSDRLAVMGVPLMPEITPVDTTRSNGVSQPDTMREVISVSQAKENVQLMGDTVAHVLEDENLIKVDGVAGPVTDTACQMPAAMNEDCFVGVLGGVTAVAIDTKNKPTLGKATETPVAKTGKIGVLLYPNPVAQGQLLTVKVDGILHGHYEVVTVSGQLLSTKKVSLNEKQSVSILISSWPAGTYFLRLVDEDVKNVATQKFVVQ